MSKLKQDIETLFQTIEDSTIAEFCKSYANNNSDFADLLVKVLLYPTGSTYEERLECIPIEVEECFSDDTLFDKRPKNKPFHNWELVNQKLLRLIRRGHFFAENGFICEAILLSTATIEKVSEIYIEDEVWNDRRLNGEETLIINRAIELLESILDNNSLSIDMLIELNHQFNIFSSMEAHLQYELYSFEDIQEKIVAKIYSTAE